MIVALIFLLPLLELIFFNRIKAINEFVKISNIASKMSCTLYGAKHENDSFIVALFKEPTEVTSNNESMEIHAKIYPSKKDAFHDSKDEFFDRHCRLKHHGSLNDEHKRIFGQDDPNVFCTSIFDSIKKFNEHRISKGFTAVLPSDNRLDTIYAGDCRALKRDAQATRIVMHEKVYRVISEYVKYLNDNIPDKKTSIEDFIGNLLTDVPVVTTYPTDGNLDENRNIKQLEMFLGTLLQVSSPTRFINDCSKKNGGIKEIKKKIIKDGFVTSFSGPTFPTNIDFDTRFHFIVSSDPDPLANYDPLKFSTMSHADVLTGTIFKFLFPKRMSFAEIEALDQSERRKRFVQVYLSDGSYVYFDAYFFAARIKLSLIPFILDANQRAKDAGKKGIIVITPWITNHITLLPIDLHKLFMAACMDGISAVQKKGKVQYISDIIFNRFDTVAKNSYEELLANIQNQNDIFYHYALDLNITDVEAMEDYIEDLDERLLFYSVSSEGASFRGNEYWAGKLDNSLAAAAASCSTFAQIQNPIINFSLIPPSYQVFDD